MTEKQSNNPPTPVETPHPRKRRKSRKSMRRMLVERICAADAAPAKIADELGVSIEEIARMAQDDATIEQLRALARLADVQAQMLVSRYRASAALRLIAIASTDKPTELARRACVDLLKADLDVFTGSDGHSPAEPGADVPPAPSEQAILQALEQLGEASAT